jgi:sialic acid synthase SpsE
VAYGPTEGERNAVLRRRSLYVTQNLEAGDVLTAENVRSIRPGLGLAPKHLDLVIGRHVNQAVSRATPLSWAILS